MTKLSGSVAALACGLLLSAAAAAESLRITVIGGGGMIGQRIVREALDRGHHVQLLARDPGRVTALTPALSLREREDRGERERLHVVQGHVLDAAGIAKVAAGQDVVISAVGAARAQDPDYDLYLNAARSLIDALRRIDGSAPRLIVVGGVGALTDSAGALMLERAPPDRRPEHLGQKAALDFYRTVDDVRWTYVSPPARIAPGERRGVYRTGTDVLLVDDKGGSSISMEDYAVALIDEAERPRHIKRRFTMAY